MQLIYNKDTLSAISKIGIEPKVGKYYVFDKNDNVLLEENISEKQLARFLSVDPLEKDMPKWSPYNFTINNPIRFINLDGRAPRDIIDITKNNKGKWEITNVQIAEGNDIFRVTNEGKTTNYIFSEGEGASGFAVTPRGTASTEINSGKRLPDDIYSLSATGNDQSAFKWVQPLLNTGEKVGYVGERGVKIHPAPSKLTQTKVSQWTAACYVVSKDYSLQNGDVYYNSKQSIKTSNQINTILGGTKHYNSIGKKNRPGSDFGNGINFKLIQKTGF